MARFGVRSHPNSRFAVPGMPSRLPATHEETGSGVSRKLGNRYQIERARSGGKLIATPDRARKGYHEATDSDTQDPEASASARRINRHLNRMSYACVSFMIRRSPTSGFTSQASHQAMNSVTSTRLFVVSQL